MTKTFTVIELKDFIGKPLSEVKEYLEKTYPGRLATDEDRSAFMETYKPDTDTEEWRWYVFFGSLLRNSDGYWLVPDVHWYGSKLACGADWLGSGWDPSYRVVLLDGSLPVDPLPAPVPVPLNLGPLQLALENLLVEIKKLK